MLTPYYQDDSATIYHGDMFEVLHDLHGIGAVVTDAPYSSGGAYRSDRTRQTTDKYVATSTMTYNHEFAGDNRDQRSFAVWCTMWLAAALHASVPGAPLVSFIDWRQLPTLTDAVQAGGWVWRGFSTWWKPGIRMQAGRFSLSAEYLVTGSNGPVVAGRRSPAERVQPRAGARRRQGAHRGETDAGAALGPRDRPGRRRCPRPVHGFRRDARRVESRRPPLDRDRRRRALLRSHGPPPRAGLAVRSTRAARGNCSRGAARWLRRARP